MNTNAILAQLDAEIARLTQVRSLLAASEASSVKFPAGKTLPVVARKRKKHVLSPEARKRIADAQRKRWAAQKAKGSAAKAKK
jgi:hypothetical protein